jgi:hypothetical protein
MTGCAKAFRSGWLVAALAATGCDQRTSSSARAMSISDSLPFDHVILAVDSLGKGIDLLQRATGVTAVFGGAHPGRGTQNALLSLGDGRYVELMAPNHDDTSATGRTGAAARAKRFASLAPLTPIGWAVHVSDAERERSRLAAHGLPVSDIQPGARQRPDGRLLGWRTFDPWGGREREVLPFAIEWAAESPHPSLDAPTGCRLVDLQIVTPAVDSLRQLFEKTGWPVTIRAGAREQLEVTLDCPTGRVRFPSGG